MLAGEVEVDETFIGGKARNMHETQAQREDHRDRRQGQRDRLRHGRARRQGARGARQQLFRVQNYRAHIKECVEAGAAIFSDEWAGYASLGDDYRHEVINHAVEYVNGNTHTNTMENFWALLKRGLHGTYISVEPYHLFRYIDEQAFRYNNRKDMNDGGRFVVAMQQIVGKRLTFDELTGKTGEMEPGSEIPGSENPF